MSTRYYLRTAIASESYAEIGWSGSFSTASDDAASTPNDKNTAKVLSGAIGAAWGGTTKQYLETSAVAGYSMLGAWMSPKLASQSISSESSFQFNEAWNDNTGQALGWGCMYIYLWHSGSGKGENLSEDLQVDDQQISDWADYYWRTITSSIPNDIEVPTGSQIVLEVWGNHRNTSADAKTITIAINGADETVDENNVSSTNCGAWLEYSGDLILEEDYVPVATASPNIPALSTPTSGAVSVSSDPGTMTWEAPLGPADSYHIQIASDVDFISIISESDETSEIYTASLNTSSLYFWRVNASNSFGSSSYSDIWNYTTLNYTGTYVGPDWYVDTTNGDDSSEGSIASPWQTINKSVQAYATVSAGHHIHIRSGTYNEAAGCVLTGSAGNPVQISAYHNGASYEDVTMTGRFFIEDASAFIHIHDFNVFSSSNNGIRIEGGFNDVENNETIVENMKVHKSVEDNIVFGYQGYHGKVTISNCEASGSTGGGGIVIYTLGSASFINNVSCYNRTKGISYAAGGASESWNTYMSGNIVYNNTESGIDVHGHCPIIEYNIIHHNGIADMEEGEYGDKNFGMQQADSGVIRYNFILDSGRYGLTIISGSHEIYNNTVIESIHHFSASFQTDRAPFIMYQYAHDCYVKNNIFVNRAPYSELLDPDVFMGIVIAETADYASSEFDYNIYYCPSHPENKISWIAGTTRSLAELQAWGSQDVSSSDSDPLFLNWDSGSIDNTSPAYQAGTINISPNITLSDTPDIGWWQYSSIIATQSSGIIVDLLAIARIYI